MDRIKKSLIGLATDNLPILILLVVYVLATLIAWGYDKYGAEVGKIPISFFVLGSLIGTLAESSTRNLTKGNNIKATLRMTYRKTTSFDNVMELLLIAMKWLAFSIAGIALATMAANLTQVQCDHSCTTNRN